MDKFIGYTMQNLSRFGIVSALSFLMLFVYSDGHCSFPVEWRGSWYENNIGDLVNISQHHISHKGVCEQEQDNKFIVRHGKGDKRCYRCLVFTYRPDNILEYKESFCLSEKRSLATICPRIMPNTMLRTLIRETSKPIPCPFQGNYQFSYSNSSAMCSNPFSTVSSCSSQSQLEFHFKQCSNNIDSHNIDLELKCIAEWKSGGNFLMGKFTELMSLKEMYRCFMYENKGSSVLVAMSADATCRGLIDPRDGPVTMSLTQDEISYPVGRDEFPGWMWRLGTKWHDLSGQYTYHIDHSNTEIRISYRTERGEKKVVEALRCYLIDHMTTTDRLFQAISMTSRDCVTKFQCVRILRRTDNVVEFHRANWVSLQSEACYEDNFRKGVKHLLIPSEAPGVKCPYDGRYDVIIADHSGCRSTFSSGCDESTHLRVDVTCASFQGTRLKCLSTWTYNATTYMIARRQHGGLQANCFSFKRQADQSVSFSLDEACNMGAPLLQGEHVKYTLRRPSSTCSGELLRSTSGSRSADHGSQDFVSGTEMSNAGLNSVYRGHSLVITLSATLLTMTLTWRLHDS